MASTMLKLSHLKRTLCFDNVLLQTAQLNTMGTSSFAMIPIGAQSADQGSWNQLPLKEAPQPQEPEASVWM